MIIGIIIAHNASLPLGFVNSLLDVANYTRIIQEGPSIPENRNIVFEKARFINEDLLFIDSDMVFSKEQVEKMAIHLETYDVVTGYYVLSFPGFPPSIFKKDEKNHYKIAKGKKEMFEVDGCGAGFLGISKRVLNSLSEPFTLIRDDKTGHNHGEDISFCINAQMNGFKIYCDPSLSVGHIKTVVKHCSVEN